MPQPFFSLARRGLLRLDKVSMPARNSRKKYTENGYYHIYNRGVEKRIIFEDAQDYAVFLSYLKQYLTSKNTDLLQDKLSNPSTTYKEKAKIIKELRLNNFADEISVIAYCLMPNHFHFLVKQKNATSIDLFMNSIGTRYTMYFNKKYKRVGSLYQGVYKAVLIESDEQLLHLTRYIHLQALEVSTSQGEALQIQLYSYENYTGKQNTNWVKPNDILAFFSKRNPLLSYSAFVNGNTNTKMDNVDISNIIIEN